MCHTGVEAPDEHAGTGRAIPRDVIFPGSAPAEDGAPAVDWKTLAQRFFSGAALVGT